MQEFPTALVDVPLAAGDEAASVVIRDHFFAFHLPRIVLDHADAEEAAALRFVFCFGARVAL